MTTSATASYVISPENGQSAAQQKNDIYYCSEWATKKTDYYPDDYKAGKSSASETKKHFNIMIRFNEIKYACLQNTGYIVKKN